MKHHLKISVSDKPSADGLVSCRTLTLRERILTFLFGSRRKITVLVPGDSVQEVAISEVKKGGVNDDSES